MKKHVVACAIASMIPMMCCVLAAQVPRTKPPNSNISPLGPHAQQPPGGQHPVPTGAIYGFVYWDAKATSHLSPSICSALAVTVGVASTKPFPSYTSIGTQSDFKPIATVHPPPTSINTTSYDGCAYSYDNVPLGQGLQVKLSLTQPVGMLTPATVANDPPAGPIQIGNAPCSKLPPLTKATVGDLTGNWGSCQNVAYDVNFPLVKAGQLTVLSSSGGSGGNQGGSQSGVLPDPTRSAGMLAHASPQNSGTGASPRGMLLPAVTPAPTQTASKSRLGTPGQLLPAKPSGGETVQLNPQPYPPKGNTGPMQAMSANGGGSSSGITKTGMTSAESIGTKETPASRMALTPVGVSTAVGGGCIGTHLPTSTLLLEFTTGKDDLRGVVNNLDVEVHLTNGTFQSAQNINKKQRWQNNSVNRVEIPLNPPVTLDRIKEIRLIHNAQALFPATEDNWEMTQLRVFARGQGQSENVANYGFNKFTGTVPELAVPMGCAPKPGYVNALRFDVRTGSDDLRGDSEDGKSNNLEIEVIGHGIATSCFSNYACDNVNGGVNWANNSQHTFTVYLSQPVLPEQIEAINMSTPSAAFSGDNWNMDSVQVTAIGNGVGKLFATHGFYRFTSSSGALALDIVK